MTTIPSILPPNATPLQKDLEQTTAARLAMLDSSLQYLNNPDLCPEYLLPWLAWAVSVEVWSDEWGAGQKRATIRNSVQVHKQKGTLGAIRRAVAVFAEYMKIDIKEWFDYGGDPFRFRLDVEIIKDGITFDHLNEILRAVVQNKNIRSHLDSFNPQIKTDNAQPFIGGATGALETITIYPLEE